MHDLDLLKDYIVVMAIALAVLTVARRFNLNNISSFLLAGVVVSFFGQNGMEWLGGVEVVEFLAEVAVGVLLLQVGMELTRDKLKQMFNYIVAGGCVQMALTLAMTAIVYFILFEQSWIGAFFIGALVAMSSTVLVIRLLQENRKMNTPVGQLCVGILLFQDLMLLPLALIIPALGQPEASGLEVLGQIAIGVVAIVATFVIEARLIKPFLDHYKKSRSQDGFIMAVVLICTGTVYIFLSFGLSHALGMFLAGVLISRTDYRHEVFGNVEKYRDLMSPIFFVSVGMLFNPWIFFESLENSAIILGTLLGMVAIKFIGAFLTARFSKLSLRSSIRAGGMLAQVGEMSFILASLGVAHGVISGADYEVFIFLAVVSMFATPISIRISDFFALKFPQTSVSNPAVHTPEGEEAELRDHLILVGLGTTGRSVAEAMLMVNQELVLVELDPDLIDDEMGKSFPWVLGDISDPHILHTANVEKARAIFLAFDVIDEVEQAIAAIRNIRPDITIVARTRSEAEAKQLEEYDNLELTIAELGESLAGIERVLQVLGYPAFGRARGSKVVDRVRGARNPA